MCQAAGADAATTRYPQVPEVGGAGASRSPTRARNPAGVLKAAAAPMPGAGERLQSVAGSGEKRPHNGGRAGRGSECQGGQGHSPSPLVGVPPPSSLGPK